MEGINALYDLIALKINYFSYQAYEAISGHFRITITLVLALGMLAQWMAWRYRFPSIALLLGFGFVVGPIGNIVDPDVMLGKLLVPLVSLSVALILFEGGLNLKFSEIKNVRGVVRNLITSGALVTWILSSAAAYFFLGLNFSLSALFGSILIVTGPTVIQPLLRHIKPAPRMASILKWEGITIDPVGAILAVLVYEAILAGEFQSATYLVVTNFFYIALAGAACGITGAAALYRLMKYRLLPEYLHNPVTLSMVVATFTISNYFKGESGLLAVTLAGILLANQRAVDVKRILAFKEDLRVLLLSVLFIVLAARLKFSDFDHFNSGCLYFLAFLILVIRPLCVYVSTIGSGLDYREKIFLSFMAPRGIVAASVASIFAMNLAASGEKNAELLVPLTFMVIIGTVIFYSVFSPLAASWLKLSNPVRAGVLIAGAQEVERKIASALAGCGARVMLIDSNPHNVGEALKEGLRAFRGSVIAEEILEEIDLNEFGCFLALTSNDDVNSLAVLRFSEIFDRDECYQLPRHDEDSVSKALCGRFLFGSGLDYYRISEFISSNATVEVSGSGVEAAGGSGRPSPGGKVFPLFAVGEGGNVEAFTAEGDLRPAPGSKVVSLVCAG